MSLFATRPVINGDEITITYTKLTDTRKMRRSRRLEMYRFTCECEYCTLPINESAAASDAARLELDGFWIRHRSLHEWCENLSLDDKYLVDGHKRCISLHEQEGITSVDYVVHIEGLAGVCGMLGDKKFRFWGLRAIEEIERMKIRNPTPWKEWLADPQSNFKYWNRRKFRKNRRY